MCDVSAVSGVYDDTIMAALTAMFSQPSNVNLFFQQPKHKSTQNCSESTTYSIPACSVSAVSSVYDDIIMAALTAMFSQPSSVNLFFNKLTINQLKTALSLPLIPFLSAELMMLFLFRPHLTKIRGRVCVCVWGGGFLS